MKNRKIKPLLLAGLSALFTVVVAVAVFMAYGFRQMKIFKERESDIETLTRICITSTNIRDTADLVNTLERDHVKLFAPIPVDPTKPCFRLIYQYEAAYPSAIMIEETNIRDNAAIYVSKMDGTVDLEPLKP